MREVIKQLNELTKNDLALFDVDMVLIQPQDPAFQMANMKRYHALVKKIVAQVPDEKQDIFWSLMVIQSESVLIDPETPKLLQQLQDKGVFSVAITAFITGTLQHIDNMQMWRISRLRQLGIDFSRTAPYAKMISFDDFPPYRGFHSAYQEGILFINGSSGCSKGDLLVAFLKKAQFFPKKIVFIDDRLEHVKSVEASLQKFYPQIECVGIHFMGAKSYCSPYISEADFQVKWEQIATLAQTL
jgi:hypothetical protein